MENSCLYYEANELMMENLEIKDIISDVGTPAYIYSEKSLAEQLESLKNALTVIKSLICYSVKGCHNTNIVRFFAERGCGADIVSGGELYRAIKAGVDPKKIVYSGVAKTVREIGEAAEAEILMLNTESEAELERINKVGGDKQKRIPVSIRVNPSVDAKTHPYITTGLKENKFGIEVEKAIELYIKASRMDNIEIRGISFHIGSQLLDIKPFKDTMEILAGCVERIESLGIRIRYIDVGGGLGIPYRESDLQVSVAEYAEYITKPFRHRNDITFIFEPGRFLTAQAGILVTQVQYVKQNSYGKKFVIVDTGMHHLIRPALYGGFHKVMPVLRRGGENSVVDIVGPICESTDFLAKERTIEELFQDDLLAITNAGSYGMAMASHYNSHTLPAEVMVSGSEYKIIRKRESYKDIICREIIE